MLVFFPKPDQITFIGVTFFLRNKVICTNAHGINIKNYNNYYNHELLSSQQVKKIHHAPTDENHSLSHCLVFNQSGECRNQ